MVKENIYLDNAATTALAPEVLQEMMPFLQQEYGNPSSLHNAGRKARLAIEKARKCVAELLNVQPTTIFFTSGGTESNNTVINGLARAGTVQCILTTATEHHAVLRPAMKSGVQTVFINTDEFGKPDLQDLERHLSVVDGKCLVALMAANNETGVLTDINQVARLCGLHEAMFHTDAVQYIGHYPTDLFASGVHFAAASGHKFHGPKGTGILYVKDGIKVPALIDGGGQERNVRSGTENVAGIVGFAKALEMAMQGYEVHKKQIDNLRTYLKKALLEIFPGIVINEEPGAEHLYTVLSASIPFEDESRGFVMELDREGIAVSGGSACSGGGGSHVMKALGRAEQYETVRFSFSKYNQALEIVTLIRALKRIQNEN